MSAAALTAVAAALAAAAPAPAEAPAREAAGAETMTGISAQKFLLMLDGMDIHAQLVTIPQTEETANRLGVTAETDGLYWDAIFYNCGDRHISLFDAAAIEVGSRPPPDTGPSRCRDFSLSAAFDLEFPVSIQTINRFNLDYRFARAVLTPEGAPVVEMDINLEGGVSEEALKIELNAWRALLISFADHVGY